MCVCVSKLCICTEFELLHTHINNRAYFQSSQILACFQLQPDLGFFLLFQLQPDLGLFSVAARFRLVSSYSQV